MDRDGVLNIGRDESMTLGTFCSGLMDNIRIYNRAIRPQEIPYVGQAATKRWIAVGPSPHETGLGKLVSWTGAGSIPTAAIGSG